MILQAAHGVGGSPPFTNSAPLDTIGSPVLTRPRSTLAFVLLSASLFACGANTVEEEAGGSSGSGGSSNGGSSNGGSANGGSGGANAGSSGTAGSAGSTAGSAGSSGSAAGNAGSAGGDACTSCVSANCSDQANQCNQNADCVSLLDCVAQGTAQQTCVDMYPNGYEDAQVYSDCFNTNCSSECGGGGGCGFTTNNATCDSCIQTNCCAQGNACKADQACTDCATGASMTGCDSNALLNEFYGCMDNSCASECP